MARKFGLSPKVVALLNAELEKYEATNSTVNGNDTHKVEESLNEIR